MLTSRPGQGIMAMMMESDSDDSSTGSDAGQLWGGGMDGTANNDDNSEYESSADDMGSENESDSESSIEITFAPSRLQTTVGRGMNGSHLIGRKRRLEAARAKNRSLYGGNTNSQGNNGSSSSNNNNNVDRFDDSSSDDSDSDNDIYVRGNCSNAVALTEIQKGNDLGAGNVPASKLPNGASTEITSEKSKSDGETMNVESTSNTAGSNSTDVSSIDKTTVNDTKSRSQETDGVDRESHKLSREEKMAKRKGAAAKSTSKKRSKSHLTTGAPESGVFDDLFCNGKDFLSWAGVTDPNDFLRRSKEYAERVNVWRKDRNLPLFNDTTGYVEKLRKQVRENMKSIALRTMKHGKLNGASTGAPTGFDGLTKTKKRRKNNKKAMYPPMMDLPMNGGDFMKYMKMQSMEDIFKRNNLHKHVNEWRKSQKLPLVNNELACIGNWRKWIRQNMKYPEGTAVGVNTRANTPDEIDSSNCMEVVSSLSKRFLNSETGLPVYQFAVYDTLCTDVIYEFRVEAKPSLIPNAGNGAFLTFLGAREAPCPIEDSDIEFEVETIKPLVSRDLEGYHMNIKVMGEHLLDNDKRMQYPTPTTIPSIHGSPEERTIGTSKYPWPLNPEGEHLKSRYVENPETLFSSNRIGCSVIELGRYGPFRRSDRKFQLHYDLKNFIFSNEVSEWGFAVVEDLNGHEQVADVTDDTTGMPHDITKQNICMYVNETGGDPELKQTVWSDQVLDREVNYYFKTDKPMKKGDTIELLISYFGTYDEIRERKGYGESIKRGNVHSDDHFPSFLERNFIERYNIIEVIYEEELVMDLYLLSEFLEDIRKNLAEIVDAFIEELQSSSEGRRVPYAQQIIALRRLNWLKPFLLTKIESLQSKVDTSEKNAAMAIKIPMLKRCAENARRLEWASWPILMDLLEKHPNLVDGKGINVRRKFRDEVTEEVCYGVSTSLVCPCNEAVWCDVASTLIHDLCYIIARDLWNYSKTKPPSNLSKDLMDKAMKASEAIQNPRSINMLKFDTDIWKRYALNNRGDIAKEPHGTKCLMRLANDCDGPEKRLPAPFILKGDLPVDQTQVLNVIHKPWYLVRQILFVADTFAKKYLAGDKSYSFEVLRQKIGVTSEATSYFLKWDIELDLESRLFYGKEFASDYASGNSINPLNERSNRKRSKKTDLERKGRLLSVPVRKLLFWDVLIKRLQELDWKIEKGNRINDWYLLPPGVSRGKGFKPRVDFFDSGPLVINALKTDTRYCNEPDIKSIMEEYGKCQIEFEKIKSSKSKELKTLSNKEIVQYLRKKVGESSNESATTDTKIQEKGVARANVVFHSGKLGLLLSVVDGQVVVKKVVNLKLGMQINAGDAMIAVGDSCTKKKSLPDVCELIQQAGRPVTITFERQI